MSIATRYLSYRDLDTSLTGLFCWNEAQEGPRPGILLIHGGAGLDGHAREQACRYAALGYAVLACDMFGDGIAGDRERVMACLLALRDQIIPGTQNIEQLDDSPAVQKLDIVRGAPRTATFSAALNDSFGFGGHNMALVFTTA